MQTTDGVAASYRVTGRHFYSKADGLPAELFPLGGRPRLVLITCGGEFDQATGSYEENVVVAADPA